MLNIFSCVHLPLVYLLVKCLFVSFTHFLIELLLLFYCRGFSQNGLYFQSSFRFTAKLSRKYMSPHMYSLPTINTPHQGSTFTTTHEPTLMHHQPKPIVHIRFTLGVVYSIGLGTCIMTCTHHCSIIENNFTALKILCVLFIHPYLSLNPWQPLIILVSPQFHLFQNVMQLESYM